MVEGWGEADEWGVGVGGVRGAGELVLCDLQQTGGQTQEALHVQQRAAPAGGREGTAAGGAGGRQGTRSGEGSCGEEKRGVGKREKETRGLVPYYSRTVKTCLKNEYYQL